MTRYRGRVNVPRLLFPFPRRTRRSEGPQAPAARHSTRKRILIWSTLAALAAGLLGLAQPAEDYLRLSRNLIRLHPPSGQTVIVGIDDHSVEQLGSWPWSRTRQAQIVDRLKAAGARRVFFDILFNARSTPGNDAAFVKSMCDAKNVWLAASLTQDIATYQWKPKLPRPEFSKCSGTVSIAIRYSGLALIRRLPMATEIGGKVVPSMAAELAGVHGEVGEDFPIDYAIDVRKMQMVSAVDVVEGKAGRSVFAGKDVVIALASRELGDLYFIPNRGLVHGAYVMVAGAETLRNGRPADLGWLGPLMVAFFLSTTHLFARRRWLGRIALGIGLFGVTGAPLLAEAYHVVFDTMPALILVGAVAISRAWANFRQSYKVRGTINTVTGLPNLNALRGATVEEGAVLVGARVRNFAEISSALPPEDERALVDQIVARLALGARGARIHQGDEGVFLWVSSPAVTGPDQLDALHALFRSPALIDGRPIDLSVTFGTDAIDDRSLANRIGATLVAADEAAAEGLRWKAYDPAKLADAEWKLSLLGRLDAAIDLGEVWVAYQPQLEISSGRLVGAEALVRWSHPEKGEIGPMEFVLAAEQHNRIDKLTEFVLAQAIGAAADMNRRGIAFEVAVNISARLLEKPGLVDVVRRLLAESNLAPERLTLEVTESAAMTSGRQSIRTLEEVGSLGINVSIDDYGTGFSTLEYFKKIPATEVKIDRSFVASIDRNPSDRVMVRSTIELAHSLGRSVVAEGVETNEILAELAALGCDKVQGYLIGKPMKLDALTEMMIRDSDVDAGKMVKNL